MHRTANKHFLIFVAALVLLGGCSGTDTRPSVVNGPLPSQAPQPSIAPAPQQVPAVEPKSPYGNPDSYVVFGKRYYTLKTSAGFREQGVASWYGKKFHGRKTSSGEIYDMYKMTAAHKSLPLPSYVRVRNLENDRTIILRVNDRGPFHDNRVIDLSYAAARELGIIAKGTARVEIEAVAAGGQPLPRVADATSTAEPTAARDFYIQIGAFNERHNAERLSTQVATHLTTKVRVLENASSQPKFRVQIGPVATVASADRLVTYLPRLGINEHHFVSN